MPIDATRVIILIIVVAGFITAFVLLKDKLNKSCTTGDIYDEKLQMCIKDCSKIPYMKYSSTKKDCVPNCLDGQQLCGDKGCVSNNMQCIDNSYICKSNEEGCGGLCMNPSTQQCINDKIYNNDKVCDSSKAIICGKNQHCNFSKDKCIDCPEDQVVCGVNNTCCAAGEYCTTDGKCSKCDPKDKITCGNTCCNKDKQHCSIDNKCVDCTQALCQGKTCCKKDETCMPDASCCPSDRSYDNNTKCCNSRLCGDKCCGNNQECVNGKCMTKCGNSYCDDNTQTCDSTIYKGQKVYVCKTKDCTFDSLNYTPMNINSKVKDDPVKVCQRDGDPPTYYASKQVDMSSLYRIAKDHEHLTEDAKKRGIQCHAQDCFFRLAEYGSDTYEYNEDTKECIATFDCNIELKDKLTECPFNDVNQCCQDKNGFTGQVCKDGQICDNGVCSYGFSCTREGKCVINMDPKSHNHIYKTKAECENTCAIEKLTSNGNKVELPGTDGGFLGCFPIITEKANTYCHAMGMEKSTGKYDWTCTYQRGNSHGVKADGDCNTWCDCTGTIHDTSIY